jgi:hypothetical protein
METYLWNFVKLCVVVNREIFVELCVVVNGEIFVELCVVVKEEIFHQSVRVNLVPKLLYRLSNSECRMLVYYCVNFISMTVSIFCVLYQTLLSLKRFKCNCTHSETQSNGP